MYPVDVCDVLLWVVVYDLCLRNCVESIGADHEGTDEFDDIAHFYLNAM